MHRCRSVALATLAMVCLGLSGSAYADEMLKYRTFTHVTNLQTIEVGDVEGHVLGVNRQSGIASFPDGSMATTYFTGSVDYTKGTGNVLTAYQNITFEDGSMLWIKSVAKVIANDPKSIVKGTMRILGGKGRYAGATGDGTFTGTRLTPLGAGADLYLENTLNVKKQL